MIVRSIDANGLKENIEKFNRLGYVWYAVKTNSNIQVLKELEQVGDIKYAISSVKHAKVLIEDLGVNPNRLFVINVLLDEKDLKHMIDLGVTNFTVNSINMLKTLEKLASDNLSIAVRIGVYHVSNNKLLNCSIKEAIRIIDRAKNSMLVGNIGISIYNNVKDTANKDQRNSLIKLRNELGHSRYKSLDFINYGGIDENVENNVKTLTNSFDTEPIVNLEVGRGIINNVIHIECEVQQLKKCKKEIFVAIELGIYSGLFDVIKYPNREYNISLFVKDRYNIRKEYKLSKNKGQDDVKIVLIGGSGNYDDMIGEFYTDCSIREIAESKLKKATVVFNEAGAYFEELTTTTYQMEVYNNEI